MADPTSRLEVVVGVLRRGDRVLFERRAICEVPEWSGVWAHPGGKVERGEDPRDALRREWQEELRLEAFVGGLLYEDEFFVPIHYRLRWYFVQARGSPILCEKALAIGWFTDAEIRLLPGTPRLIRAVLATTRPSGGRHDR